MKRNISRKAPALSILALSIYSHLCHSTELNLDFLHGTNAVPKILTDNGGYPAGQYLVDLFLNNNKIGRTELTISPEEEKKNSLCLNSSWLKKSGVTFTPASYEKYFDKANSCYRIEDEPNSTVDFDYGTQSLKINIPQAYLQDKKDSYSWEYGVDGARVKYFTNFNSSGSNSANIFGNVDFGLNIGRWVFSTNLNAERTNNQNKFSTNDLTISTAIKKLQGDFLIGRSQTRTNLFSDFGFYGLALRSNSNMRAAALQGYAPIISGVANSQSRITITQGGFTIYSKVVPAGPYKLDDISPVSNGDLVVTVEDQSGHKTETVYPVATLPTLLRPGEVEYNVALGKKNNDSDIKKAFSTNDGLFWLGSLNYGFTTTTLNSSAIIHNKYQGLGVGVTQSLGRLGAVEVSALTSTAKYNNGVARSGSSFNLKYAKSFSENTDLQLLTYRYQSKNYVEFSSFDANNTTRHGGNAKSRYEARVSHRFDRSYLSASYWQQSYWAQSGNERGATLSASTAINDISLYLNGSYSRSQFIDKPDYSVSLNFSIPFNIGGKNYYGNSSIGYDRGSGYRFNSGVSATINERLNYSLSADTDSKGRKGATGSVSYAFDTIQTNFSLAKNQNKTNFSGSFSGSAIATSKTGVLFTKETSNTIGIAHINEIEGVTFNSSLPTNKDGNTVVSLSEYYPNDISINMDNVPDNAEVVTTSYTVVPTEKAIVYRDFGVEHVKRYILRVKKANGEVLNNGNAKTEQKLNAGFIANNGVLLMNMLSAPKKITIDYGDGMQCSFNMSGVKANINKVQEVICE